MKALLLLCSLILPFFTGLEAARPGAQGELDWRKLRDSHLQQELNKIYGGPRWLDDLLQARKVAMLQRNNLLVLFSKRGDENSASLKRETLGEQSVWKSLGAYTLLELDVDFHFELAFEYQIRSVPTLIWMSPEGRELHRITGDVSADDLKAFIERIQNPQAVVLPPEQAGKIRNFRKNPNEEGMAELLSQFSSQQGKMVKEAVRELDPPPLETWVALLSHPTLSVRLAALELLEERAGESFRFDPWADPEGQATTLAEWKNWAEEMDKKNIPRYIPLTREQLADSLRDLNSDSEAHVVRAIQTLETAGPGLLPQLENIQDKLELTHQQTQKLNEVLINLRLEDLGWPDAAGAAFRLQRGPINTRMNLIQKLGSGGLKAIPVLTSFLDDPEVLIRESVMESLLQAGGAASLPMVLERMQTEPSTDIALAVMRRLAKLSNKEATDWLKSQLHSDQEERILGALEAMQSGKHDTLGPEVISLLDDSRWRIRATAAATLGAIHYTEALTPLMERRDDPDDFARLAILDACLNMMNNKKKKAELIAKWFEENSADTAVVLGLACERRLKLPQNLIEATLEMSKPQQLNLLQVFLECGETGIPIALKLAEAQDDDLRVSALRILARYGLGGDSREQKSQAESLLVKALQNEPEDVVEVLLRNLDLKKENSLPVFSAVTSSPSLPDSGEVADLLSAFGDDTSPAPVKETENENLDDLLSAFADPVTPETDAGPTQSLETILKYLFTETNHPGIKNHTALLLIETGDDAALDHLLTVLADINEDDLRQTMYRHSKDRAGQELALALRKDSRKELQGIALTFLARNATNTYFLPQLDKMGEDSSELSYPELKGQFSNFGNVFRQVKAFEADSYLSRWLESKDHETREDTIRTYIGLQLALSTKNKKHLSKIRRLAETHEDPDLRAFAWITLGSLERRLSPEDLEKISSDSSSRVRMTLPFLFIRGEEKAWQITPRLFPDYTLDGYDVGNSWNLFMQDSGETAIVRLLQENSSDILLLSGLALWSQRKDIPEIEVWQRTLRRAQPDHWITQIANDLLYESYQRSRDPDGFIFNWLVQHNGESYRTEQLRKKRGDKSPTSSAPKSENDLFLAEEPEKSYQAPVVVYIYSESCGDCDTVQLYLENHLAHYPDLKIQAVNLNDPGARDLYRALFRRFDLPLTGVGLTPMLAGANDIASGSEDLSYDRVGEIIASSMDGSGFSWIPAVAPGPEEDSPIIENLTLTDESSPHALENRTSPIDAAHYHGVLWLLTPCLLLVLLYPFNLGLLTKMLCLGGGFLLSYAPIPFPEQDRLLIVLIASLFPVLTYRQHIGRPPRRSSLSEGIPDTDDKKTKGKIENLFTGVLLFLLTYTLPWNEIPQTWALAMPQEKAIALFLLTLCGVLTARRHAKGRFFSSCMVSLFLFTSLLK